MEVSPPAFSCAMLHTQGKRSWFAVLACIIVFLLLNSLSSRTSPSSTTSVPHLDKLNSHIELNPEPPSTPEPFPLDKPDCNLTVLSMLYGAHKFPQLESAIETHRSNSLRWGCHFANLEYDLVDRKLYSKQYFLLSTMLQELGKPPEDRQQWLMWVDADSIVVNSALSPTIFLPPEDLPDVWALMTADHNGLNDGVFYLRVHRAAVDLLTQVVDYPLSHPDEDLGWFGEQQAMANVLKAIEARQNERKQPTGIAWVPREWFNLFQFEHGYEGKPGDFMVHFAGLGETRLSHMENWLHELEQDRAKWEIPLPETSYNNSIAEFWEGYKRKLAL